MQFFGRFLGLDLYPSSYQYASHADDQLLIFNTNSLPFDGAFTEADKNVSKILLSLWTDFVHNNQMTPSWPDLKQSNNAKLVIGTHNMQMEATDEDSKQFWTQAIWPKIILNYGQKLEQSTNPIQNKDEL